ncbi:hypothetical protein [uncultured Aeromicrobium sp.]|nr:hypothetical protein [uncultured Aeromicrobium sp.]
MQCKNDWTGSESLFGTVSASIWNHAASFSPGFDGRLHPASFMLHSR